MCAIVSTFLIFMFVDQLLLVDVFSQLYCLSHVKKQQWRNSVINRENHEKSMISILHGNLVFHRFPLSIDKKHLIASDFYRYRFSSINYSGITAFVDSSDHVTLLSSLLIELDAILISVIHNSQREENI